jgi:hypothetical protein
VADGAGSADRGGNIIVGGTDTKITIDGGVVRDNGNVTENGGNIYDIEGRNNVGGRKQAVSLSLYNKDYQYGLHLIDSEENQRQGQFKM